MSFEPDMNKKQAILALDTTMRRSAIAISRNGTLLAFLQDIPDSKGQAERLMPLIMATMKMAGLAFDSLGAIAATVGPGSFTGLRVGLAAARGIALAADIPVHGITSFDALAEAVRETTESPLDIAIAIDSRRGDLFFRLDSHGQAGEACALSPEKAADLCPKGPFIVCGDGASLLMRALPEHTNILLRDDITDPDPRIMAHMAETGRALVPPTPLYMRPPDVTLPKTS